MSEHQKTLALIATVAEAIMDMATNAIGHQEIMNVACMIDVLDRLKDDLNV